MRHDIGSAVHQVLGYGLLLKERLQRDQDLDFHTEQAVLKGRLGPVLEVRAQAGSGQPLHGGDPVAYGGALGNEPFLGARYALACWLDEVFILDSPWGRQWDERKLETALYGSNDRAFKFWEQSRLAEMQPSNDAVEVYYLCVMLGFRGELRYRPEQLQEWVHRVQQRLHSSHQEKYEGPAGHEPLTDVSPRHGREQMQTMIMVWSAVLLILLPLTVFYIVHQLLG